jgi:hypothetical protein
MADRLKRQIEALFDARIVGDLDESDEEGDRHEADDETLCGLVRNAEEEDEWEDA